MSTNNLGTFIKNARNKRGISLREAGELIGISHSYYRNIEKGVDPRTGKMILPSVGTLKKISNGFQLDFNHLMDICGYNTPIKIELDEGKVPVELTKAIFEQGFQYNNVPLTNEDKHKILGLIGILMDAKR